VSALHISEPRISGHRISKPCISVVVATHNRPRALRCALESVRRQTFDDWEVVVIGDHCTDCTPDVVASFADPRFRYVDLARNIGEQSGPNNIGIHLTQAPLIAFLNHDDLWFPDHLQVAHEGIVATGADLVFTASLNVQPTEQAVDVDRLVVTLESVGRDGAYDPADVGCIIPASTWLVRRDALASLRGWRNARDTHGVPSQELLFRLARRGCRLRSVPAVTVMTIPSGVRRGSYAGDHADEQEAMLPRLGDADLRLRLIAGDPRTTAAGAARSRRATSRRTRLWSRTLRLAPLLGRSAHELEYRFRRRGARGKYIRSLRQIRGLLDHRVGAGDHERVRFAESRRHGTFHLGARHSCATDGQGVRYLTAGWAAPETWGVWNDGTEAQLAFDLAPIPRTAVSVELDVRAFLPPGLAHQRLTARVAGRTVGALCLDGAHPAARWSIDVPPDLSERRPLVIELELPDATSPAATTGTPDHRQLAIGLAGIRITAAGSPTAGSTQRGG
jgi:hypothetical protein